MPADTVAMAVVEPILDVSSTHAIGTAVPMISTGRDGAAVVLINLIAHHSAVEGITCSMDLQLHPMLLNLDKVECAMLYLPESRAPAMHITIVVALRVIAHNAASGVIAHNAASATAASSHEFPDCMTDSITISTDIKGPASSGRRLIMCCCLWIFLLQPPAYLVAPLQ